MLMILKFIDDEKQWKIEKIFDKKIIKRKFDIKLNEQIKVRNIINDFQKKIRSNVKFNSKI